MPTFFHFYIAVLLALIVQGARAAEGCGAAGVNLAGLEFGSKIPGKFGVDYKLPSEEQVAYYADVGFKYIRVPVLWERLQPKMFAGIDPYYSSRIKRILELSRVNGLKVVLDVHNYGKYWGVAVGSGVVPAAAFQDLWKKLANEFHKFPSLHAYGLMNEPAGPIGLWHEVAQSGVDGIRSVDGVRRIYVAGDRYSGAQKWGAYNPIPFVVDPAGLEFYEAHLYIDKNSSGTYTDSIPEKSPDILVSERLAPFLEWLNRNGRRGVIGEWGVPAGSEAWVGAAKAVMSYARGYCMETYVWAGGAWSPGYKLSLEPVAGVDKPLVRELRLLLAN